MITLPLGKNTDSPIEFKAGTVIFTEGEASKYLFIVKKGQVCLLKTKGHNLRVLKVCEEKEILNEVSVLANEPIEFSAIARTDVFLVLIEQKDILAVIKSSPFWMTKIFETLCERLRTTFEIIEEHNLMIGEESIKNILSKEEEQK